MFKNLLTAALLCGSLSVAAQEQQANAPQQKEYSPTAELVSMAGKLVKYGHQTKSALPLIQALEIYNRVGWVAETEKMEKTTIVDPMAAESDDAEKTRVCYDPAQIVADATAYAEGDKQLLALIKSVGETRGNTNGPVRHVDIVKPNRTDVYTARFRGGEQAIVIVSGDGSTDLDLYIYDENSNLITSDTDVTDDCVCTFTPRWTGSFTIKVVNRGSRYNSYVLVTN